jgi:uncharacterized protein (DUF2147 family)
VLNIAPMKRLLAASAGGAFCALAAVAALGAGAPQPTAAGLREKTGDSGMPAAWFRIIDCGGSFEGKIVKMFSTSGENPSDWRCTECKGDQRNAPVLGLTFIKGMWKDGLAYEGGTILDPRDGAVYSAIMQLSPDGGQLTVRGSLGLPLLGRSETWKRLPNSSLPSNRFASCS